MASFILVIHFIVCIFMIIVILLQAGKGADIGAAFGGGSQTIFGPRGAATFLSKVTTVAAVIFLGTSIYLANVAKTLSSSSVLKGMTLPTPPPSETAPSTGSGQAPAGETKPAETAPQSGETKPK